jgi:hypothetical protein
LACIIADRILGRISERLRDETGKARAIVNPEQLIQLLLLEIFETAELWLAKFAL